MKRMPFFTARSFKPASWSTAQSRAYSSTLKADFASTVSWWYRRGILDLPSLKFGGRMRGWILFLVLTLHFWWICLSAYKISLCPLQYYSWDLWSNNRNILFVLYTTCKSRSKYAWCRAPIELLLWAQMRILRNRDRVLLSAHQNFRWGSYFSSRRTSYEETCSSWLLLRRSRRLWDA